MSNETNQETSLEKSQEIHQPLFQETDFVEKYSVENHSLENDSVNTSAEQDCIENNLAKNESIECESDENDALKSHLAEDVPVNDERDFIIDYQPVIDGKINYQIVHHQYSGEQSTQSYYHFKAYLVANEQQIFTLRQTLQQWSSGEQIQRLIATHPIECARQIVALLDYMLHHQHCQRILISSHFGKMLEQVSNCLELHTQVQYTYFNALQSFDPLDWQQASIYLGRYQDFIQWYGHQYLDEIFQNFDLIVLDEIEQEQNQLFQVLVNKYYTGRQWHIHLERPPRLSVL